MKTQRPTIRRQEDPLHSWQGAFGDSYLQRNRATQEATSEAAAVFGRMLGASGVLTEVGSVLEVGANVGINLIGLRQVLAPAARLVGLEPSPKACEELRRNAALGLEAVIEGDAYRIPSPDDAFDLSFTSGVLIHVPPDRLSGAMQEIVRVSRRFVLCIEYFSHVPVTIPYRGQAGLLWKCDFGQAYLASCPRLKVRHYGFIWQTEFPHFDNLTWWLFDKYDSSPLR